MTDRLTPVSCMSYGPWKVRHTAARKAFRNTCTPDTLADFALSYDSERSAEYRAGLLDVLKFKMRGEPIQCPHRAGSAQFDAYFAGNARGLCVYRAHLEQGGRHD